ncbi:MAG: histidine kinase dimerization/phospho-acceptor domain-containing protein, partial [Eubacteriales bacterium]|nr:histidine kinase dimerization/phospho-acceptor domain-containing protein [Eubacteriales bacterium]
METTQFMKALEAYGADMKGINDRFMGDVELYRECLDELIADPHCTALEEAVQAKTYTKAFEAAHALKGISGNLGLTPYYDAVCALVEALRTKPYGGIHEKYARVFAEQQRLRTLFSPEDTYSKAPEESASPDNDTPKPMDTPTEKEKKTPRRPMAQAKWFIPAVAAGLLLLIILIGITFTNFLQNYQTKSDIESASHLTEINHQIKLYIEEEINNDWKSAYSIAHFLASGRFGGDGEALAAFIAKARDIWGVSDIVVYMEDGTAIDAYGAMPANERALEIVHQAKARGEYSTVEDSAVTYTIPIDTELRADGAKVAAVSVMRDVASFLDRMKFSSFDGTAYVYLTQKDGIVVSRLTHEDAPAVYNFMSLLEGHELVCISKGDDHALGHMLSADETLTHLLKMPSGDLYVVSTPIKARQTDMRLFYLVPEAVVNRTLNSFSSYVVHLSVAMITVFAAIALFAFLFVYKSSKQRFDKAIMARERMFDLLVKNTKTAFGLFVVNQEKPVYLSPNAHSITGGNSLTIRKTDAGYSMESDNATETEAIRSINAEIRDWDGQSEFRSGYILNAMAPKTCYYAIQLSPIDEKGTEYVGIAQDVTQQYAREEMLKDTIDMAERANAAKSRFLSNMSHDIRTPMNAIVNMTNFAIDSIDNPRLQREYLQTIRESSDHLLRLINDVLDMSRIESGQAMMESEPFDVKAELVKLADIVRPLCAAKQQTFLTNFDDVKTTGVLGDQIKFSQIFMNLLSNAIKFTPGRGAIRFTAAEIPSLREDIVNIRFLVEDNGIGIPEKDLQLIFEPFSRAESKRANDV